MDLRSGHIVQEQQKFTCVAERNKYIITVLHENIEQCLQSQSRQYRIQCCINIFKILCDNFKYIFQTESLSASKEKIEMFYCTTYEKVLFLEKELDYNNSKKLGIYLYPDDILQLNNARYYFSRFKDLSAIRTKTFKI